MPGSANQGRDSILKLVEEDQITDLLEYSHREGLSGRDIIYKEESMTEWLSAEYCLELKNYR